MKYSALLYLSVLACIPAWTADYSTQQAARMTIGQATFTDQYPGASDRLLGAAGGVAYANDMLFVADSTRVGGATPQNNRVMIYRNISSKFPSADANIPVNTSRCPVCTAQPDFPSAADVVLGQPNFTASDPAATQTGMRTPTAVASDGNILVVADTDNNRILIWKSIPAAIGTPADIVLGQKDFTTIQQPIVVTASSFRGPQGVWVQGGKLYVADTQNHRVLVWNSIPSQNNQPADIVLGEPNFTTAPEPDLTKFTTSAHANTMVNPVSVTSDGTHLFVTDLGYHRVLIWNSIPTQNQQPADVVVGEPDMDTTLEGGNDVHRLCLPTGTDSNNNPTYPDRCQRTLSFPRFALSDGERLYIADGGNDRVLIYDTVPTTNGAAADIVLGQPDFISDIITDNEDIFTPNLQRSSSDTIRTPTSLAWDGTNLYVTDPYDRRVMVFTPSARLVPVDGVRNAASLAVYAVGSIAFTTAPASGDKLTITITGPGQSTGTDYSYTAQANDGIPEMIAGIVAAINAGNGDPYVFAIADVPANAVKLTARAPGPDGNNITVASSTSDNATVAVTTTNPTGGQSAATIGPGTIVSIMGLLLSDGTAAAPANADPLPTELANTQVYFDGIQAPLLYVSPTQINAQIPWEVLDATSISAWVRTKHANGTVTVTNAVGVPVAPQNPGIYADSGTDPRPAVAYHYSSNATASVQVDGTINAGDTGTITIEDRGYTYTVQATDTLQTVRDALIAMINANPDEKVTAQAAATNFTRILLTAKVPGDAGNGIPIAASNSTNADLILTVSQTALCCASQGGSRITPDNPAVPGEMIVVYGTGLGLVTPEEAKQGLRTGYKYNGPAQNDPYNFVSALAGGKTANVISAGADPGMVGTYKIVLELNSGLTTDPAAELTIAQDIYISNIVTIPVYSPNPVPPQ
jgi:uncharacterized protein (TIGR03437 family)